VLYAISVIPIADLVILQWLIDKVVKTIQIAGNAASVRSRSQGLGIFVQANTVQAFPPAMPAALIFNAFGQVMTSFSQVSADYDKVVAFFEFMQRFLDRLSMIEGKKPPLEQFDRCIIRVFASMLTILAVSQDYAKEHGRFSKYHCRSTNVELIADSGPKRNGSRRSWKAPILVWQEPTKTWTRRSKR
jgi:hypothetical protein